MKRIMISSLAALGLLLGTHQEASAWSKFRFSVGMNISWEGSGNSVLFGLLKGSPAPYPMDGGYPQGGYSQGPASPYSPGMIAGGFGPPPQGPAYPQPATTQTVSYSPFQAMTPDPNRMGFQPPYGGAAPQPPSYWYGK